MVIKQPENTAAVLSVQHTTVSTTATVDTLAAKAAHTVEIGNTLDTPATTATVVRPLSETVNPLAATDTRASMALLDVVMDMTVSILDMLVNPLLIDRLMVAIVIVLMAAIIMGTLLDGLMLEIIALAAMVDQLEDMLPLHTDTEPSQILIPRVFQQ